MKLVDKIVKQLFYHKIMPDVKVRRFMIELKHRPPDDATGEREELIETITVIVPRLANSEWEKRWCAMVVWNLFSQEAAREHKINQAFIFTADFKELIMRLEINDFVDEECHKLPPPSQDEHDKWHRQVEKRFRTLYNQKLDDWLKKERKNCFQ